MDGSYIKLQVCSPKIVLLTCMFMLSHRFINSNAALHLVYTNTGLQLAATVGSP